MKKFRLAAISLILFTSIKCFGQTYEVPKDYAFTTKDDYAKSEPQVIGAIDWLQQTPFSEQPEKRKEVNAFLIKWLTGSPAVSVEVGSGVLKFNQTNNEYLIIFMGAYAKYVIQNRPALDKNQANAAALRAIIAKYNSEPNHIKDKNIERIAKLDKEGKLDDWVKTDFNKP
jgi:hypothetical protein